jgi:hypothetical protein
MYIILSNPSVQTNVLFDANNNNVIIRCTNPQGDVVDVYLSPEQIEAAHQKLVENKFGGEI